MESTIALTAEGSDRVPLIANDMCMAEGVSGTPRRSEHKEAYARQFEVQFSALDKQVGALTQRLYVVELQLAAAVASCESDRNALEEVKDDCYCKH